MLADGKSEDDIIYELLSKGLNGVSNAGRDLDVWGRPYRLEVDVSNQTALFYSMGKNGIDGEGGGDVISYQFDLSTSY